MYTTFLIASFLAGGGEVVVLSESFDFTSNQDAQRSSGGVWGNGALVPGPGGGSGQLGDLIVGPGETVVLSTTSQDFAGVGVLDNYDPVTGMPGATTLTVDDGVFQFAYVDVDQGGTLRFEGEHPARVYARGTLDVDGVIDVAGESVEPFLSMPCDSAVDDPLSDFFCGPLAPEDFLGQAGGLAGPGGGSGGKGGDAPDAEATLQAALGLDNPNVFIELDGQDGEGVPVPNAFEPTGSAGVALAGIHWPSILPPTAFDLGDVEILNVSVTCSARQVGGAGAGGAHATPGASAINKNLPIGGGGGPIAPFAPGGDPSELLLDPLAKTLDPALGLLRGGAGGAGSGASVGGTATGGLIFQCLETGGPLIADFQQSRGAGGGGGGGAFQGQAGAFVSVSGQINASGGLGGRGILSTDRLNKVSPGGSGAGGAILLQGPGVQLAAVPGRVNVSGGPKVNGGISATGSENICVGGAGGAGFVRVESGFSNTTLLDFDSVVSKVAPSAEDLANYPAAPIPADVVSVENWGVEDDAPGTFSGVQSCWRFPAGQPGDVTFLDDAPGVPAWDFQVLTLVPGVDALPFRQRNNELQVTLEKLLGTDLGAAPIVVRFQGARAEAPVTNPCFVDVNDPAGPIVPGSLTPWVRHPAELNDFFGDPALAANLIRFQIVFDRANAFMPFIAGLTDLAILTQVNG